MSNQETTEKEKTEQKETQISISPTAIMHFSSAFGGIFPFGTIVVPYIVHHLAREQWQEQSVELKAIKRDILIFQLPLCVASLLLMFFIPSYVSRLPIEALSNLFAFTILPFMAAALGLVQFGVPLYAGIRVLAGYAFKYPTLVALKK